MSQQQPEWLSLSAAAKLLNIHPTTLRRWADNGEIPFLLTPGGHRRFNNDDIRQFAEKRHGVRKPHGMVQRWADAAVANARHEIVIHQQYNWISSLDEPTRQHNRQLGQQLMALTLQYLLNGEGDQLLLEARGIGQQYGETAIAAGLPLTEALEASMFFRDTLVETALQLPENARVRPEANIQLMRRINTLLNTVLLAIAEVYDGWNIDR